MAVSKVILNGDTLIDLTSDTATTSSLLSGVTAHDNSGSSITGTIASKTSADITVNGPTITVPAGAYSESNSVTIPSATVISEQTYTANPIIDFDSSTGEIYAYNSSYNTSYIIPVAGYANQTTANATISGSTTRQLPTKSAATIVPTTTTQTIVSGKYLTGAQTIAGDANLVPANIASGVSIFGVTGTHQGGAQMTPLNVTQNGTYTAPSGTGYTPVTVNVQAQTVGNTYFIDYDGTILHTYTNTEAASLTALPSNPTHSGLTAQGWNWTLSEIQDYIDDYSNADIWVGQMYVTTNGNTEVDISITNAQLLNIAINVGVNGTLTIDWGDNSSDDTVTDTSISTNHVIQHSYSNIGNYTISCSMSSGNFTFHGFNQESFIIRINGTSIQENKVFSSLVKAIRLGNNFNTISTYSFQYCSNLETITIPQTVAYLGNNAFYKSSIKSITLPHNSSLTLMSYLCSYCEDLTSVSLPGNLAGSIKSYCFQHCRKLKSITLPSQVSTNIEASAFQGCYSLESIVVPYSITSIATYGFSSCYNLRNVDLSKSRISIINSNAFSTCYSLQNISIPDTLKSIYSSAFNNCYSLESITANNVTTIQAQAFMGCYSLKSASFPKVYQIPNYTQVFSGCASLQSVTFDENITRLGTSSFYGCYNLSSISSLDKLTSIESQTFYQCASLTSFVISSTVTTIGASALAYTGIKSINVPDTVSSIAGAVFQGCYDLVSVKLPSGLTTISGSLFYACHSLLSIDIPNTVTSIGASAFYQCYSLTELTIPEGVLTIGNSAFQYCTVLKTIIIPSTVTSIGTNVFNSDTSLISITINATTPPTLGATQTMPTTCTIYVPTASLEAYQTASVWSNYASQMVGI